MTACTSAAVIGLGLIGGSLSRDLAARGVRVRAYDADADHLASAMRDGVVHEALDATLAGVAGAEVIVIAVPVDAAIEILGRLEPFAAGARLITDVGSTKARIVASAIDVGLGERFVGSHPMAGGHRSGWDASRAGLFEGAPVYLCPTSRASEDARSLADAFWRDVGARPICMDAERHDNQLAWTSHLPHIVSTALALALAEADVGRDGLSDPAVATSRVLPAARPTSGPRSLSTTPPRSMARWRPPRSRSRDFAARWPGMMLSSYTNGSLSRESGSTADCARHSFHHAYFRSKNHRVRGRRGVGRAASGARVCVGRRWASHRR